MYNLAYRGKRIHASWKTIYIRTGCDGPSDRTDVAWRIFKIASSHSSPPSFRLSHDVINSMSSLGMMFESGQLECLKNDVGPQVWYKFVETNSAEEIVVRVGACVASGRRCIWAYSVERHAETWRQWRPHLGHDCATDHIKEWSQWAGFYGKSPQERMITLWSTKCPHTPETLVLQVYLKGSVYEKMLRAANVTLPPPYIEIEILALEHQEKAATSSSIKTSSRQHRDRDPDMSLVGLISDIGPTSVSLP